MACMAHTCGVLKVREPLYLRQDCEGSACRPAVVLSYVAAAVAALLSGLAYAELVVDMPLAGGAFSCTLAIFSEPFAW